MAKCNQLTPAL